MKTCSKCGESKPLEAYHKAKSEKDGLRVDCKNCRVSDSSTYYVKNKQVINRKAALSRNNNREKIRQRDREYYQENKEKFAARSKDYRLRNIDTLKAKSAEYRESHKKQIARIGGIYRSENKESTATKKKTYARNNPHVMNNISLRYKTQKAENGVNLVKNEEIALISSSPCRACGEAGPSDVDHIIPISRGGAHTIGNLMPLCPSCNRSKGGLLYIEWKYSARPQALKAFAA